MGARDHSERRLGAIPPGESHVESSTVSGRRLSRRRLVFAVSSAAAAQPESQQRLTDRRAFLNDVETSDDPRRVPAPPGPRGPEGTTVLRGGLVFDGTGSDPFAGTVVMERNRIVAVLPDSAAGWPEGETDWPADARVLDVSGQPFFPG